MEYAKWIDFIKNPLTRTSILNKTKQIINEVFKDDLTHLANGFETVVYNQLLFGIAPNLELLYLNTQAEQLLHRILYQELPQVYIQWIQFIKDDKFNLNKITKSNATMSDGYSGLSLDNQDGQYKIDKANTTTDKSSNLEIYMKMKDIETRLFTRIFARIEKELVVMVWAI